jgi:hypothetical protein
MLFVAAHVGDLHLQSDSTHHWVGFVLVAAKIITLSSTSSFHRSPSICCCHISPPVIVWFIVLCWWSSLHRRLQCLVGPHMGLYDLFLWVVVLVCDFYYLPFSFINFYRLGTSGAAFMLAVLVATCAASTACMQYKFSQYVRIDSLQVSSSFYFHCVHIQIFFSLCPSMPCESTYFFIGQPLSSFFC